MEQTTLPPVNPAPVTNWYKATIWRRFLALIIDSLILVPGYLILVVIIGSNNNSGFLALTFSLIVWAYMVFFTWRNGATLGKKWLKIKVVQVDGKPLSLWQAFLREVIGKFISGIIFDLGYLWAIWDKDRQAWHDKIARTYVVTQIPNDGKKSTILIILAILLLVLPLIAILAAIVVMSINPLELIRQSRDAARLSDATIIQSAIDSTLVKNPGLNLCNGQEECSGASAQTNARALDGSGWVKIDLTEEANMQQILKAGLPVDPINDGELMYVYCSNGIDWEINLKVESEQYAKEMSEDQGDDDLFYEKGSSLTLCPLRAQNL